MPSADWLCSYPFWNLNWETVRVIATKAFVTALGSLAGPRIIIFVTTSGENEDAYRMSLVSAVSVMSWSMNCPQATRRMVTAWSWKPSSCGRDASGKPQEGRHLVEVGRDCPGRRQRVAGDGSSGSRDTVSIVRGQEPVVACVDILQSGDHCYGYRSWRRPSGGSAGCYRFPPQNGTWPGGHHGGGSFGLPLHVTLGCHQEGGAVLLDDRLGRVDQRKTIGDGILGESVLLSKVPDDQVRLGGGGESQPAGLMDHSAQVADIMGGELAPDGRQTNPVAGREERGVDGVVGDAGVLGVKGYRGSSKCMVCMVKCTELDIIDVYVRL